MNTEHICSKRVSKCTISPELDVPLPARMASPSQLYEAFNNEIEPDFVYVHIWKTKYCFLHVVEEETAYSGNSYLKFAFRRLYGTFLEVIWIHPHGKPAFFLQIPNSQVVS